MLHYILLGRTKDMVDSDAVVVRRTTRDRLPMHLRFGVNYSKKLMYRNILQRVKFGGLDIAVLCSFRYIRAGGLGTSKPSAT